MTTSDSTSRFVILRHEVGPRLDRTEETHFDWMFEIDGVLKTWATAPVNGFEQPFEISGQQLKDHRAAYLEFEGEIAPDRGHVWRVLEGTFQLVDRSDQRLKAEMCWEDDSGQHHAEIEFYRILVDERLRVDVKRAGWFLRFSPCR